jgi:DNA-binding transcriptional MerR regulator
MSGAGVRPVGGADILGAVTPKLFKAGDVCDAAGVQPYVLRSWEKEFPGIGVQKSPETPRLYRQSDVEQVLRIKQLVFVEGLTLAGARRRIEESSPQAAAEARDAEIAEVLDTLGADVRKRIALVRNGLKSILDVLSRNPGTAALAPVRGASAAARKPASARNANDRGRSGTSRQPARATSSKRRAPAAKASKSKRRRAAGRV